MFRGSICAGVFFALCTLINQILKPSFCDSIDPNSINKIIGGISFVMLVAGAFSGPTVGILVDRTKLFKTFCLSNHVVFTLCFIGVTILFHHGLVWADFVLFGLIGSCVSSMFNLIMQFSFEVTYSFYKIANKEIKLTFPEPCTFVAGFIGIFQQLSGVILTQIAQAILINEESSSGLKLKRMI